MFLSSSHLGKSCSLPSADVELFVFNALSEMKETLFTF